MKEFDEHSKYFDKKSLRCIFQRMSFKLYFFIQKCDLTKWIQDLYFIGLKVETK